MFVTDKLVYLQLQKTGCTHIVRVMNDLVGGKSVGPKHGRLQKTFALADRKIVGSIRDPWSWYVSLWAFGCLRDGAVYATTTRRNFGKYVTHRSNGRHQRLRGIWRELTKPTWRWTRLYADSTNAALFRDWLKIVLDPRRAHDLPQDYGSSTLSRYAGFLTYRYARLYAADVQPLFPPLGLQTLDELRKFDDRQNIVNLMIRTESLEDDLIRVLRMAGHEITEAAETRIRAAQRTNTSEHGPTREYYDKETIDLVARREAFIIQKYGYTPPA